MSGRVLLAARWILLGVAALATVAAVGIAWQHDRPIRDPDARYVCPMHPEVTSFTPGECPICRMALARVPTEREPASGATSAPDTMRADGRDEGYVIRPVVFTDSVRAPAFVESPGILAAHLYVDEVAALEPGAQGVFTLAAAPSATANARVTPDPASRWDDATSLVRLQIDTDDSRFVVGATGWLRFAPKVRHADLVPAAAVLQSPDGPYVFAAAPGQPTFEPRPVRLGKVFYGNAVVMSGLQEHESVALRGLFFLDAARRLQRTHGSDEPNAGHAP